MVNKKINNEIKKYDARGLLVINEYYNYINENKSITPHYLELLKLTLDYFIDNDISINRDEIKQYTDLYILKHNIPNIYDTVQYISRYFAYNRDLNQ